MKLDLEDHIHDIVAASSARLGDTLLPGTTRLIGRPALKEDVTDATQAFFIDGVSPEYSCVLLLSNPDAPDFVAEAASKASHARSVLGDGLGQRVCVPVLTGSWAKQSYSLYKRLDGYSQNKYLRRVQTLWSAGMVLEWLADVFGQTKHELTAKENGFLEPLHALSEDDSLAEHVQQAAIGLCSRVQSGELRTFKCLQHGDFWFGNVMFPRNLIGATAPLQKEFQIIDWAGSEISGYPAVDALRFSLSVFGHGEYASRKLQAYCRATDLTKAEFALHSVCAVGWLHANLNHFPKPRFNAMASNIVQFLSRHDFL